MKKVSMILDAVKVSSRNISILFTIVFLSVFNSSLFAQKKYNLIFINIDDISITNGTYGNSFAPTPNIDRLAKKGVLFRNVYCQYSLCSPSRTSTFSGTRVRTTQIVNNDDSIRKALGPGFRFLPEYFHDNGYRTECYGKFMCAHDEEVSWDYYINETTGEGGFRDGNSDDDFLKNQTAKPQGNNDGRQEPIWFIDTIHKNINSTADGQETNQFISSIKKPVSTPFFYNLGLQTHNFFTPLLQYWNKTGDGSYKELLPVDSGFIYTNVYGNGSDNIPLSQCPDDDTADIPKIALKYLYHYTDSAIQRLRHAYYAEMIQADVNVGKVLDQIDSLGLWDNSVIVLWSDHGLSMGEHDGMYLKIDMFEECLRIPMIIYAPGIQPGVCDKLVESVDLYQTLTELCGLPKQDGKEGASLVPLMENHDLPWKKAIFSNLQRNANFDTLLATAVRTERWHYNNWQDQGEELYDIKNDSQEIYNLAKNAAFIDTLNMMRNLMNNGWQAAAPPQYPSFTMYRDNDGDGFGNINEQINSYFGRQGFVAISGDCDDNNASVNPAHPEVICNNIDDNCNGFTDEYKPVATITPLAEPDLCKTNPITLSTNGNDSCIYHWTKDNIEITGASSKTLITNEEGRYSVSIIWPNACQSTSDDINIYKSCNPEDLLTVYPMPTAGKVTIDYISVLNENVQILVYNSTGALVYKSPKQAFTGFNVYSADLSFLANGVFFIRIGSNEKKIIIEH